MTARSETSLVQRRVGASGATITAFRPRSAGSKMRRMFWLP